MIDFPQAIDQRMNGKAFDLLQRDIANVCGYFERYGVSEDAFGLARRLWSRFVMGEF